MLGRTSEPEPRLREGSRGLSFPSCGVRTAEGGKRSAVWGSGQVHRPEHVSPGLSCPGS